MNVNYQQERVQCGKHNCHCNTSDPNQWHGPYWRAYWNDPKTGKKQSFYVGKKFTPPQGPPRPQAHSERRAPPDETTREQARESQEPPSSGRREQRHEERPPPPPPPPRGSRFEQAAAVLGVSLSASQADAKKAYRKLAIENHPDRHRGAERVRREEIMKQINAAWDTYQRYRGWK